MTKVEKVKKMMEKYGLSIEDLQDVDDEETDTEPKTEEVKTDEVEGTKETEKEVETKAEEPKVEGTTEEVKAENANDIYKTQFEELNKKYDELKSLVEAQAMKTDKAYEILDAQGKKPNEEEYPYEQKLGTSDIRPNLNNSSADDMQFANALSHKKIR